MDGFEQKFRNALGELLPAMEPDGGGAEIVSCRDGQVTLRLIGSCLFCPSRALSAAALERGLRARVPELEALCFEYPGAKAGAPELPLAQLVKA